MSRQPRKLSNSHCEAAVLEKDLGALVDQRDSTKTGPPPYHESNRLHHESDITDFHEIALEKPVSMAGESQPDPRLLAASRQNNNIRFSSTMPKRESIFCPMDILRILLMVMVGTLLTWCLYTAGMAIKADHMRHHGGTNETSSADNATTAHAVSTRSAPSLERRSAQSCWDGLISICANDAQVPADRTSDGFGECADTYRYFYCGLITSHPSSGNGNGNAGGAVVATGGKNPARVISVKPSILGRASNRAGARAVVDFSACHNMLDFCIESQIKDPQQAPQQAPQVPKAPQDPPAQAPPEKGSAAAPKPTVKETTTLPGSDGITVTAPLPRAVAVTRSPSFTLTARAISTPSASSEDEHLVKTWI